MLAGVAYLHLFWGILPTFWEMTVSGIVLSMPFMIFTLRQNYIRMCRMRLGLSQSQLAALLGMKSATRLSKVELGERKPTIADCVTFHVLFGKSTEQIWPRLDKHLRTNLDLNLRRLISQLEQEHSRSERKRKRTRITCRKLRDIANSLSILK